MNQDEVHYLVSAGMVKEWVTHMMAQPENQTMTLTQYRQQLYQQPFYQAPTFKLAWGDSFLIDNMYFHAGGKHFFHHFPHLNHPQVGDIVQLSKDNDNQHYVITSSGLLTFDATVYTPRNRDNSDDTCSSDSD